MWDKLAYRPIRIHIRPANNISDRPCIQEPEKTKSPEKSLLDKIKRKLITLKSSMENNEHHGDFVFLFQAVSNAQMRYINMTSSANK